LKFEEKIYKERERERKKQREGERERERRGENSNSKNKNKHTHNQNRKQGLNKFFFSSTDLVPSARRPSSDPLRPSSC
jgi:DNA polymerase sigma